MGFNAAALLSGGKYKKQITLIHISWVQKGDDMPAFVWETWEEWFHRRRQEEKEYRRKLQRITRKSWIQLIGITE